MAPEGSRKRVKTSSSSASLPPTALALIPLPESSPGTPAQESSKTPDLSAQSSDKPSWYFGTWPRKAEPVAQVAPESITKANITVSESYSPIPRQKGKPRLPRRSSSLQLTRGNSNLNRSSPADATTTRINATSEGSFPRLTSPVNDARSIKEEVAESPMTGSNKSPTSKGHRQCQQKCQDDKKTSAEDTSNLDNENRDQNGQASERSAQPGDSTGAGWLGWFSKPVMEPEKITGDSSEVVNSSEPAPPKEDPPPVTIADCEGLTKNDAQETVAASVARRSWLPGWSNHSKTPSIASGSSNAANGSDIAPKSQKPSLAVPGASATPSKASSIMASSPPDLPGDASKSAGWIFWSRSKKGNNSTEAEEMHEGEIAISDTPSQKRPKRASISFNSKDSLPVEKEAQSSGGKEAIKPGTSAPNSKPREPKIIPGQAPASGQSKTAETEASKQLKKATPNLVLPSFDDTFAFEESPSVMRQLGRFLSYAKTSEPVHVSLVRDPPRIKNAIAIGVHGYFPAPFIRSVLGQPTGTSIKFADMATKAIKTWTKDRGYSCEIKTAALEGEGRIAERVDLLWKLLLNWADEIRKADFIMLACHSQGVPVTTMLVAKLIECGFVDSARVGICAMAGINQGPFPDYKSRWFGERANELFDFSDPSSTVSKDYIAALDTVLRFGVRIVYSGSLDDQLVSMESSTFSPLAHPYIYRAVFVDGRIHTPNFLANLVGFTLKLRNLGVPDHGFIRELSPSLAGSLYSGEGHSRIYEDDAVYLLSVRFALETTSPVKNVSLAHTSGTSGPPSANPYILPFAMRGLLEEPKVKNDLSDEAADILRQFDDWKPTSRVLKDAKFRLEGVRWRL